MTRERDAARDTDPGTDPGMDPTATNWERVVEDMTATADEYRERGWDAIEIHPGDVMVATDDRRTGLEVLAPDDEFDRAAAAVDDSDGFESANVFRAETEGVLYFVVVLEDPSAETALLYPVQYAPGEETDFVEMVEKEGEVRTHVRPLDQRRVLTFTHDDPSLFLPGE
ncbi:MAG: hypothetical protein ABEH83_11860 [Halobacterium sp.]